MVFILLLNLKTCFVPHYKNVSFFLNCSCEYFEIVFKELHSYWPRANAAKKFKRSEMPDKETWKAYKIRVLAYAGKFYY
jgi:hypothetical protein